MPVTPDLQEMLEERARGRVGRTLRDKYRLDRVLGVGGMAAVYAATHRNGNEVALKLLHPELAFHPSERARFLREGYAANLVKHSGAVSVSDDDITEENWAFLVMELLHGRTVDELWASRAYRLSPGVVIAITLQVLDVVEAAHAAGVVHRDLKPANLFLTNDGDLKVLDFGIARLRDFAGHRTTNVGTIIGTPSFMAPEQAIGRSKEVDERTDLWAIGSVAFALLVGDVVHPAESAQETLVRAATQPSRRLAPLVPGLPTEVAGVLDRALAFEKRDRWPSATVMRAALVAASEEVYGEVPGRKTLKAVLSAPSAPCLGGHPAETLDLPHADTELPPEPLVGPVAGPAPAPLAQPLMTTGAAQLASAPAIEMLASPPPKRWRMGRTGVMGGVAMLLGALFVVRAGTAPLASAAPNVDITPRAVVGNLTLRPPEVPTPTDPPFSHTAAEEEALAEVDAGGDTPLATKGETPASPLVRARTTGVAATASSTVRAAPVPARPSCTPPFVIQAHTGRKIWKLECL
jgi:hypothetical protein